MTGDRDSYNRLKSFKFSAGKTPLDWDKLVLDFDRIISTRDVKALISVLDDVIKCNIDAEINRIGFGEMFVKLFRLSQLGVEYLLHCKSFLESLLSQTEMEVERLKQEIMSYRQTGIGQPKKRKTKVVLTAAVKYATFKCTLCRKVFVSDNHLKHHLSRQHLKEITGKGQEKHNDVTFKTTNPKYNNVCNDSKWGGEENFEVVSKKDSQIPVSENNKPKTDRNPSEVTLEKCITSIDSKLGFKSREHSGYKFDHLVKLSGLSNIQKSFPDRSNQSGSTKFIEGRPKYLPETSVGNEDRGCSGQKVLRTTTEGVKSQQGIYQEGKPINIAKISNQEGSPHSEIFIKTLLNEREYNNSTDEESTSITTESETTSSEEIDYMRVRDDVEHELETKLRSLGIDPEWQKLPDATAKSNAALLSEMRKTYAHVDENYYALRNQLKLEVEKQAQLLGNTQAGNVNH